jgi:hypothetical protein
MNSNDQKYNGWTNQATWAINNWLNATDNETLLAATECANSGPDQLREYVEELVEQQCSSRASLASDLITIALNQANFDEIADGLTTSQ